eukprot:SAG25_NODE_71_length_17290_cov_41.467861_7_plen_1335_part_00
MGGRGAVLLLAALALVVHFDCGGAGDGLSPCTIQESTLRTLRHNYDGLVLHVYNAEPQTGYCGVGTCGAGGDAPCVIPVGKKCQVDCAAGYEDNDYPEVMGLSCRNSSSSGAGGCELDTRRLPKCTLCNQTSFKVAAGSTPCTPCPPGMWTGIVGATQRDSCQPVPEPEPEPEPLCTIQSDMLPEGLALHSYAGSDPQAAYCGVNTCGADGDAPCVIPVGKICQVDCEAGFADTDPGSVKGLKCVRANGGRGELDTSELPTCNLCDNLSYKKGTNNTACTPCPAGSWTGIQGATQRSNCKQIPPSTQPGSGCMDGAADNLDPRTAPSELLLGGWSQSAYANPSHWDTTTSANIVLVGGFQPDCRLLPSVDPWPAYAPRHVFLTLGGFEVGTASTVEHCTVDYLHQIVSQLQIMRAEGIAFDLEGVLDPGHDNKLLGKLQSFVAMLRKFIPTLQVIVIPENDPANHAYKLYDGWVDFVSPMLYAGDNTYQQQPDPIQQLRKSISNWLEVGWPAAKVFLTYQTDSAFKDVQKHPHTDTVIAFISQEATTKAFAGVLGWPSIVSQANTQAMQAIAAATMEKLASITAVTGPVYDNRRCNYSCDGLSTYFGVQSVSPTRCFIQQGDDNSWPTDAVKVVSGKLIIQAHYGDQSLRNRVEATGATVVLRHVYMNDLRVTAAHAIGGAVQITQGRLIVQFSTFVGKNGMEVTEAGGAIFVDGSQFVLIEHSVFQQNLNAVSLSAITQQVKVSGCRFENNVGGDDDRASSLFIDNSVQSSYPTQVVIINSGGTHNSGKCMLGIRRNDDTTCIVTANTSGPWPYVVAEAPSESCSVPMAAVGISSFTCNGTLASQSSCVSAPCRDIACNNNNGDAKISCNQGILVWSGCQARRCALHGPQLSCQHDGVCCQYPWQQEPFCNCPGWGSGDSSINPTCALDHCAVAELQGQQLCAGGSKCVRVIRSPYFKCVYDLHLTVAAIVATVLFSLLPVSWIRNHFNTKLRSEIPITPQPRKNSRSLILRSRPESVGIIALVSTAGGVAMFLVNVSFTISIAANGHWSLFACAVCSQAIGSALALWLGVTMMDKLQRAEPMAMAEWHRINRKWWVWTMAVATLSSQLHTPLNILRKKAGDSLAKGSVRTYKSVVVDLPHCFISLAVLHILAAENELCSVNWLGDTFFCPVAPVSASMMLALVRLLVAVLSILRSAFGPGGFGNFLIVGCIRGCIDPCLNLPCVSKCEQNCCSNNSSTATANSGHSQELLSRDEFVPHLAAAESSINVNRLSSFTSSDLTFSITESDQWTSDCIVTCEGCETLEQVTISIQTQLSIQNQISIQLFDISFNTW